MKASMKAIFDASHSGDGKLEWAQYWAAVKDKFPDAVEADKKATFDEMAGADGHLTWEKVEAWIHAKFP